MIRISPIRLQPAGIQIIQTLPLFRLNQRNPGQRPAPGLIIPVLLGPRIRLPLNSQHFSQLIDESTSIQRTKQDIPVFKPDMELQVTHRLSLFQGNCDDSVTIRFKLQ
jgi:hypothetical protein